MEQQYAIYVNNLYDQFLFDYIIDNIRAQYLWMLFIFILIINNIQKCKQMISEQSLAEKQKYLRQTILDTGHDAEAFIAFCQSKYGEIDLEGWKFSKLKQCVKEFLGDKAERTFTQKELDDDVEIVREFEEQVQVSNEGPGQHDGQLNFGNNQKNITENKKQLVFSEADWEIFGLGPPPPKKQAVKTVTHNQHPVAADYKNFTSISNSPTQPQPTTQTPKSLPTLPTSPRNHPSTNLSTQHPTESLQPPLPPQSSPLSTVTNTNKIIELGQIQIDVIASKILPPMPCVNDIKIIRTQQKSRNFLQSDYTVYVIQLLPCNVVIHKRFNQFRKLRMILQRIYPHVRLPYLEPQGWLVHSSSQGKDPQTLSKYKYQIIQFLKYITIRNQLLKRSKIVHIFCSFLTQTDIKKYQNIIKPKQLSQLCLPNGKLKFPKYQTIQPIDKYILNTQNLILNIDTCYQKLKKSLQTLFYYYQLVGKSLVDVAGVFEMLEMLVQKFNFDNDGRKDLRVFEGVKEVCTKMKQTIDGQYQIFKNKIQQLFKYQRDNITTIKQSSSDPRQKMYNQLSRQNLNTKKSSQFFPSSSQLINIQGNILIEDPTKTNKNQLFIQNMFWSSATLKNIQDYWNQFRFKVNQMLTLIAYQQLDGENRELNFWNLVIKKCVI